MRVLIEADGFRILAEGTDRIIVNHDTTIYRLSQDGMSIYNANSGTEVKRMRNPNKDLLAFFKDQHR